MRDASHSFTLFAYKNAKKNMNKLKAKHGHIEQTCKTVTYDGIITL